MSEKTTPQQESIELKTMASDKTQTTAILNNIGHCHLQMGDANTAIKYFNLALSKGQENGQMADVVRSYGNLVKVYRSIDDHERALTFQSELLSLKDSLSEVARREAVTELEVKYETDRKEKEIMLLQQEKTIITNRWLTLALGLFLAIIIGILFIDNQKRKHRHEKKLLVAEDELQKAELKIMSDLLEYNRKKLSLYTENLLKKNELVGTLEDRLKESVEASVSVPEEGKKLIQDFSSVRILTEEDWDEFKGLFDSVHKGLLKRLLETYSDLTLADQRLFLLMKLGLSTQQIANILGVSPDSVKKGRYRLKKKIAADSDSPLQEFVNSF